MGLGNTRANALSEFVELLRVAPPRTKPGVTVPLETELLAVLGRLVPCDAVVYNDHAINRCTEWAQSVSFGGYDTQDDFVDTQDDFVDGDDQEFFDLYWGSYCSHPERTGDFESVVVGTDFWSLRADRASPMYRLLREYDAAFDRVMLVPLTSPPGHSRRVRFVRAHGREFSDDERALATLVRPHLVARMRALDLASREVAPLTARQRQLLTLVADGYSNQQAARTLGISALTVRSHLEQIYARLGVHSRTEAVAALRTPGPQVPHRWAWSGWRSLRRASCDTAMSSPSPTYRCGSRAGDRSRGSSRRGRPPARGGEHPTNVVWPSPVRAADCGPGRRLGGQSAVRR